VAELAVVALIAVNRGEHLDRHPVQRDLLYSGLAEIPQELYEAGH